MRNTIIRTLTTSEIFGCKIIVKNGTPEIVQLESIKVQGKVNDEQALKHLVKKYGKDSSLSVTKVLEDSDTYEISIDDFMKYAKKVNSTETK